MPLPQAGRQQSEAKIECPSKGLIFGLEVKAVKKKLMIALASLAVVGAAVAGFLHRSR